MVNLVPGFSPRSAATRTARSGVGQRKSSAAERAEFAPPPRPGANFIPSPAMLQELIGRALDALSRGIYWDRGSIINILL